MSCFWRLSRLCRKYHTTGVCLLSCKTGTFVLSTGRNSGTCSSFSTSTSGTYSEVSTTSTSTVGTTVEIFAVIVDVVSKISVDDAAATTSSRVLAVGDLNDIIVVSCVPVVGVFIIWDIVFSLFDNGTCVLSTTVSF
jgi:hypothetical protein